MFEIDPNMDIPEEKTNAEVYFFGYGANRSKERIATIIGHQPEGGYGAFIQNYRLCFQKLDDIPDGPRAILNDVWGPDFRAYTIRQSPGVTAGVIWRLTLLDMKRIEEWEFIGQWQEILKVQATMYTGKKIEAISQMAPPSGSISGVMDGIHYEDNLNYHINHKATTNDHKYDDEYRMKEIFKIRNFLHSVVI